MLFVSNAYAQSGASEPNMLFNFVLFGGLFLFMYLIILLFTGVFILPILDHFP